MSRSAGCRCIEWTDDEMRATFPALIMYPADAPERPETFGPYTVDVALHSPVAAGTYPLVVISPGSGGSHLLYRGLAAHLARHGLVVVLPEHLLNNRNDNTLGGTAANLANRPRHLRLVIDWAFSSDLLGPHLMPDTVAIVGHSLGGYTAPALAGGRPVAFPTPATPWFMTAGPWTRCTSRCSC